MKTNNRDLFLLFDMRTRAALYVFAARVRKIAEIVPYARASSFC